MLGALGEQLGDHRIVVLEPLLDDRIRLLGQRPLDAHLGHGAWLRPDELHIAVVVDLRHGLADGPGLQRHIPSVPRLPRAPRLSWTGDLFGLCWHRAERCARAKGERASDHARARRVQCRSESVLGCDVIGCHRRVPGPARWEGLRHHGDQASRRARMVDLRLRCLSASSDENPLPTHRPRCYTWLRRDRRAEPSLLVTVTRPAAPQSTAAKTA